MKTCRCNGANPGCHWCGGKGFLSETDDRPHPSNRVPATIRDTRSAVQSLRTNPRPDSKTAKPLLAAKEQKVSAKLRRSASTTACPSCGVQMRVSNAKGHRERCRVSNQLLVDSQPQSKLCPFCTDPIVMEVYASHAQACRGSRTPPPPQLPSAREGVNQSTKAPTGSNPRRIQFPPPVASAPVRQAPQMRTTNARKPPLAAKAGMPAPEGENRADKTERRLDTHRNTGSMARDHGRFGSFPIEDDYGEESEP